MKAFVMSQVKDKGGAQSSTVFGTMLALNPVL
jgi:hypothetical protein